MGEFQIRTDLALEAKENCEAEHETIRGVKVEEQENREAEIYTTIVTIETENGARAMGKPVGTYVTLESPNMSSPDEGYHREISEELARHLKHLIGAEKLSDKRILVVGLGNREVTPDALGPDVVGNLNITRHMIRVYGRISEELRQAGVISAIVPGVMAQTGMETVEIIRGVVKETKPELVLVIDALAARSTKRLNRTIQITDTGINPGSGVGNHRNAITRETVGVPVIAIGVPTVVDAATIVNDTMENLIAALESSETLRGVGVVLQGYNAAEKYELVKELISPHLNGLFVTPKDIDETVKRISFTISEALNAFLCPQGHAHN